MAYEIQRAVLVRSKGGLRNENTSVMGIFISVPNEGGLPSMADAMATAGGIAKACGLAVEGIDKTPYYVLVEVPGEQVDDEAES
jgi:hypothetical protein